MKEIRDSVIVVTGASGGIGSAICRKLASQGARLVMVARDKARLTALAKELPAALAMAEDVTKEGSATRIVDKALAKFGRIDALVNGAGRGMWEPIEKIDLRRYQELFELNVLAALRLMQAVIPVMRKQGGGAIVNISSASSKLFIVPNLAGYSSTKYALNCLSLTAREEVKKDGITVSVIYPILVNTDFGRNSVVPEPDWLRAPGPSDPKLPMITAEDVSEKLSALLLSGEAEMIVGPQTH
jgi:short-subunit dehydrogenase